MKEAKPIMAGTKAPMFKLLNQEGNTIELKNVLKEYDYVLVYFYPRAMTPGCTTQACELESSKKIYHRKKIKVLGISPDKQESLLKFSVKEGLSFDLLSDVDHEVADAFGVWGKKTFMGKTKEGIHRVSFLISQNGTILHTMAKVNTKTHHEDVLALIKN